jgi:hypothetical protein
VGRTDWVEFSKLSTDRSRAGCNRIASRDKAEAEIRAEAVRSNEFLSGHLLCTLLDNHARRALIWRTRTCWLLQQAAKQATKFFTLRATNAQQRSILDISRHSILAAARAQPIFIFFLLSRGQLAAYANQVGIASVFFWTPIARTTGLSVVRLDRNVRKALR